VNIMCGDDGHVNIICGMIQNNVYNNINKHTHTHTHTYRKVSDKLPVAQYRKFMDKKQELRLPGIKHVCEYKKVIFNTRINMRYVILICS
jgi:hypothetical protein